MRNFSELKPKLSKRHRIKRALNTLKTFNKERIFCIGFNKTGTTSLKVLFQREGYVVGSEYEAKFLFEAWRLRQWGTIVKFCRTADFFQDSPFSLPYTFIPLHQAFPKSKFILSIRDDEEQWYNSLIKFHGKLWGNGNIPPTAEDLKKAKGVYTGRPYHTILNIFNVTESEPYQKDILIKAYKDHISNVEDYFRHCPDQLIKINVSRNQDYGRLCEFIGLNPTGDSFPWENKT